MTKEIFHLILPNCMKNNGGYDLWCFSMGVSLSLLCFFLNCIYILYQNYQWNIHFDAPQLKEKKWWRCSMVLLNGRFSKAGFFLTQLCQNTPPQWPMKYCLWCSSIARKTMMEILYGAPQWEILQYWFVSYSIVSRYSTQLPMKYFPWCSSIARKWLLNN